MTERTEAARPDAPRRILVAIDPARVRAAPIEAAARLARELGMEFAALVVEEQSFLRVAALPFTRELSATSGQWQEYGQAEVEAYYREHARRARRLVGEICGRFELRFSIAVERGAFARRAAELTQPADWLVLDRTAAGDFSPGPFRGVAVAFDASPAATRALAAAASIARACARPLRIVVLADDDEQARALRAQARAALGEAVRPVFSRLSLEHTRDPAELRRALADGGGSLLVLPERWAPTDAAALSAALGCAVMLAR